MACEAIAIANYFLDLATRDKRTLDPMKIQKLVYFAHGWYLATRKRPLLIEFVEAWPYGPVIPSLYHEFKRYGTRPIAAKAIAFDGRGEVITPNVYDCDVQDLLNWVWEVYGSFSAIQLSNLTHDPGSPWDKVYSQNEGRRGIDIPDEVIQEYFTSVLLPATV